MVTLLLSLLSLVNPKLFVLDLILLQKKASGMQNTMAQKSEFFKMPDCSGFLQIGPLIVILITIDYGF